jgi:hypothetical protein
VIEGQLRWDPATAYPDNRCQFGFVFNALGLGRDQHWLVWTDQRRGRLEKQQGHFGHFGSVFASVSDVISPDAQNFRGLDRRQQADLIYAVGWLEAAKLTENRAFQRPDLVVVDPAELGCSGWGLEADQAHAWISRTA